jgi:hypothetical protein
MKQPSPASFLSELCHALATDEDKANAEVSLQNNDY